VVNPVATTSACTTATTIGTASAVAIARCVAVLHAEARVVNRVRLSQLLVGVARRVAVVHVEARVVERAGVAILKAASAVRVRVAIWIAFAIPCVAATATTIVIGVIARGAARLVGFAIRFHLGANGFGLFARLRPRAPRDVGLLAIGAPLAASDGRVIEADRVAKVVELELRELACVTDAQVVERQVRERHALQLVDLVAERFDHAMDLAVLAFVDRDAEPRVLRFAREALDLGGERRRAVVERDAFAQCLQVVLRELAVHFDVIGLGHVRGGREKTRGELAVVREKKDTLGIEVEAADRFDGDGKIRQIVHHRRTTAIVGDRGDASLRLVEQNVEVVERHDGLPIDQDLVDIGVDLGAEHGDDLAVDLHAAGGDEVFGFTARRYAGGREVPLQADRVRHGTRRLLRVVIDGILVGRYSDSVRASMVVGG
jgi:hypothetical protein